MPSYQRGDVIAVSFLIPHNNKTEEHPGIIISNDDVHRNEDMYICVMISHSKINDIFAYELTNEMFINPLNAPAGFVKGHLISYVIHTHIVKRSVCRMKPVYVDKLVDFISDTVLKNP